MRDWDYKKPVIEDNWEPATRAQIGVIEKLIRDLGKQERDVSPNKNLCLLSRKEAAVLIHDLHLEWLRSRGDTK